MIQIIYSLYVDSTSFSECFSVASYIRGNTQTQQLVLHLLPFELLDQISQENLCKQYLPGKPVVVKIHYKDISFPLSNEPQTSFLYQYNKEIQVVFNLSPANYNQILNYQNAMYELWYDVKLIKVNNSVNSIEHTKMNGTNCFNDISLKYSPDQIQVVTQPNNCDVVFDASLQVSLSYIIGMEKFTVSIPKCTGSCLSNQYQTSSSVFDQISLYVIKRSELNPVDQIVFDDFLTEYYKNRGIIVSFDMDYMINSVSTAISSQIIKKESLDTKGCIDTQTFRTILNYDYAMVQIRGDLQNKFLCTVAGVTQIRTVLNVFNQATGSQITMTQTIDYQTFQERIGSALSATDEYRSFADKLYSINVSHYRLLSFEFLSASDALLYDITVFGANNLGCIKYGEVMFYSNQTCVRMQFVNLPICNARTQTSASPFSVQIIQEDSKLVQSSLGLYHLSVNFAYTGFWEKICFTCAQFDSSAPSLGTSCSKNNKLVRDSHDKGQLGFTIQSQNEGTKTWGTFSLYYADVYVPLIGTAVGIAVVVAGILVATRQRGN
ncbi:Conserved_hypothetical protein [Hexamita inflata]|uniref:Uncharacterized protein n=1 Tax=Hexamita inflata TaxID=28002 RepID=A0AA86U4H1_9EUKA|nr:Conserved hypothetical protein [Hexamita inflata]